jgi:hypothetical protein
MTIILRRLARLTVICHTCLNILNVFNDFGAEFTWPTQLRTHLTSPSSLPLPSTSLEMLVGGSFELFDHVIIIIITPGLSQQQWLPAEYSITYKFCVFVHLVRVGPHTSYLPDLVTAIAKMPSCSRLRSDACYCYELPSINRKFVERCKVWNALPDILTEQLDTPSFKRSSLFERAYLSNDDIVIK